MQRKTNLFYTDSQDSNFLTFSNFTEALTGNFLSTDWKVYPSRFLCLYMPSLLEEENKEDFIKNYLVAYYENKLAFLRDHYTKALLSNDMNHFDIEGDVNSLAWLFECIKKYIDDKNTDATEEDKINYEITFIGDVTEFDYKGTYTDTICIIDSSDGYNGNNKVDSFRINVTSEAMIPYENESNVLYGWSSNELAGTPYDPKIDDEENEYKIKFDSDDREYSIYSEYELTPSVAESNSIKFNIIIPLFDITNIYYSTNFNEVDNEETNIQENLELKNYIYENDELVKRDIDYSDKEKRSINNPLGIWFSDEVIELKRDGSESKYAPSWSLVISSQFKPFPYSGQYDNNDITSKDNQQAFATYAQILASQNQLSDKFSSILSRISHLEQVTSKVNNFDKVLEDENINKILSLDELANSLNDRLDNIENTLNNLDNIISTIVEEKIKSTLKWK